MKVETTHSEVDIFQYTPKSNVRKLCLKFKTVILWQWTLTYFVTYETETRAR